LGTAVFRADLPELPELDNLFAPEGVIHAAQDLAANIFGADRTWFLVNGSTCGIEAAVLATCNPGDKIILPRNSHQSAIAALILSGAIPIFVQPEYDPDWEIAHSMTVSDVAAALEHHPDAKAVMMVYPTYHGVCGDVEAIAQLAHHYQIPLIVDEAHGAHFAFHPELPIPALAAGADVSIQSIHKVLGAMTQASMLHLRSHYVNPDRVNRALQLVQSTSPSYLLLASLDAARQQVALQGKNLITRTLELADIARTRLSQIPGVSVLPTTAAGQTPGFVALDRTRLTVDVTGLELTGFKADAILHQQLEVTAELPSLQHLTFIITLGNTQQDIEKLVRAFLILAAKFIPHPPSPIPHPPSPIPHPSPFLPPPLTPRQAFFAPTETLPIDQTGDRISAELVCPYPPGIPVLLPGERITTTALDYLHRILAFGGVITGCTDAELKTLKVVKG
jgi:arginine decarboxylase